MNGRLFGIFLAASALAAVATPSAEQWTGWRGAAAAAPSGPLLRRQRHGRDEHEGRQRGSDSAIDHDGLPCLGYPGVSLFGLE